MRRLLLKALAGLGAAAALLASAAYVAARRSLPVVNGSIAVAGISAPVEIVRDADGVPHIFAREKAGALFGLGYAHAQDRLWQMEFQRRIAQGRLSEIFGRATLPQDRFLRTVGFARAARSAWDRLPAAARGQIDAYVAGVNAFLAAHHGTTLPPEFLLLGFEPERWTGADVLAWGKMMAWDLSANYVFELLRYDLAARVGSDRAAELMPGYAPDGLSIVGPHEPIAAAWMQGLSRGDPAVADFLLGNVTSEAVGSNNWVVDGSMTASGRPMLANDPHLGTRIPSTWYLAHLSAGGFDVIGATLPGTPAVALGRNRFIAWGATNVGADVQDLYLERLDASGRFAEFGGRQEPVRVIPEIIAVKGAPAEAIDVRITRHGPLVSDAINANNAEAAPSQPRAAVLPPLAFRWTALDPQDPTIASFLELNEARNWREFVAALGSFVVPSQNFVYADVDGHIGYYAPGRIPIRASGNGAAPVEGWSGGHEWTAWVPFEALPHAFDPPSHFIVTANNRPATADYPFLLGLDWPEPYRARRIADRLRAAGAPFTPGDFEAIQADTVSLHAQTLLPVLFSHANPADERGRRALALLQAWDRDARGDSAAAAIFEAWFLRLAPTLVGDDLGPLVTANYQERFSSVTRFVVRTLAGPASAWCDDVRTPGSEGCNDAVARALREALDDLTQRLGSDMSRWRWDAVHRAVFPHSGLDAVGLLRPILSRSRPSAGDWSTVDAGPIASDRPFEQRHAPGYREVIDLSAADDSRFMIDVGQSGHPLSPHYDDFLPDWKAVRLHPMRTTAAEIAAGAAGTLRLVPAASR
ncbi:MAG: penicillin acylase family protein [Acidobacteria bacterium]|nr:penicillin acylase family protein [Acidobacteriota bacterium]